MLLKCESLSYKYNKDFGVNSISLEFESGNFYTLLGPNGSGKSTLLNLLSGTLKPQSGNILIDGKDIFSFDLKTRAELISFLPQNIFCDFPYTCMEVVSFARTAFSKFFPSEQDEKICIDALKATDTLKFANRKITELSGGEIQKVMLAQVLAQQAKIIILDEPTSHLDLACSYDILKTLYTLAKEKELIIICCMHELNTALFFSQKLIFLKNGTLIANGETKTLLTENLIKNVYGIDSKIIDFDGNQIPILRKVK